MSAKQYVGGKGHLHRLPGDSDTLAFDEIELKRPFQKYAVWGRLRWELAYGRAWVQYLRDAPAEVVVMCNVPLIAMLQFVWFSRRTGTPWVFWHQDIYSHAMAVEARSRLPKFLATVAAWVLEKIEAWYARSAVHVVAIGAGFAEVYPRWGVSPDSVSVIPNWAPLDKIVPTDRDNARSADIFGDDPGLRLLYAGTLGRKHNPLLLIELLLAVRSAGVAAVLSVVSEGEGVDILRQAADDAPDLPLRTLPFQPAADLSDVLGSADVLIGLLEPDATTFSVPSKVLSYMAAGRPILALMPADNPAAIDIEACGGCVREPTRDGARGAAQWLAALSDDRARQAEIGQRSRAVAEERFDIDDIAGRFAAVLENTQASARA